MLSLACLAAGLDMRQTFARLLRLTYGDISFVVSVGGPRTFTTGVVLISGDLSFGFSPDGLGSLYTLGTYHLVAVWVG